MYCKSDKVSHDEKREGRAGHAEGEEHGKKQHNVSQNGKHTRELYLR
jgi:hypothetical protein